MKLSDAIQLVIAAVAVGASVVALVLGYFDRRNARQIARDDRRESLRHAQLLFEQEALLRLVENLRQGGSTDPLVRSRLGGEAAGIIGFIGRGRLPLNWADRVTQEGDPHLEELLNDPETLPFNRHAIEAQLELNAVSAEIRRSLDN